MKRIVIAIVISLTLLFAAGANAEPVGPPVTYQVNGTFDDGGTLSGSFTFQQDNCSPGCSTYTDIVLTTTSGSRFPGFDYTPYIPEEPATGAGSSIGASFPPWFLNIQFAELLWSGNSSIAILSGSNEYNTYTKDVPRYIVGGTVAIVSDDGDGDGVGDNLDNCPFDPNPLQENNDGDTLGDICDPDDDNDGINDAVDNCPIDGNTNQADDDYDGLGNACDTTVDAGSIAQHVEDEVADIVLIISAINVSGGNGMISKLTGNGGVIKKMSSAIIAFNGGSIDLATYLSELDGALSMLDAFDNQIVAKISNGKIVDPDATAIIDGSAEIRTTIDNLKVAAGS